MASIKGGVWERPMLRPPPDGRQAGNGAHAVLRMGGVAHIACGELHVVTHAQCPDP